MGCSFTNGKLMKIIVKLPMYKAKVIVLIGAYQEIKHHVQRDWDFITEEETYQGICGFKIEPDSKKELYQAIIHVHAINWANIAHECLHATNYILQCIGAQASFEDDEVQAYFMTHIISTIEDYIQKKQG